MFIKDLFDDFSDITKFRDFRIEGNLNLEIDGLNLCNRETQHNAILSYATTDKYIFDVEKNIKIKAIIVDEKNRNCYLNLMYMRQGCVIVTGNPEDLFYRVHEYLCESKIFYTQYDFESKIGNDCKIDETAIIERGVLIGNNVVIGPLSVIKKGTVIEDNVVIGSSTVVGSEGFQLVYDLAGAPMHITHVGGCRLCENSYIGDNTCVCNSLFEGVTHIGKNVKIDNLVHVAHNCYVGDNAVLTAGTILCGSSVIEQGAWIGVNSSVLNKVTVGECSKIGIGSVVTRNMPSNSLAYGVPAKAKIVSESDD